MEKEFLLRASGNENTRERMDAGNKLKETS